MKKLWFKLKTFNYKRHWKLFLASGIMFLLIPAISVSIYQIRNAKAARTNKLNDRFEVPDDKIFPELEVGDYYQFIEYHNNELIIGDKLIAALISDLAARLNVSYGDINFSYEKVNNQKIAFFIEWLGKENKKLTKNFSLELN